ncbi:T9SS type A sorting domain-containing protein [Pontibacter beigongshangensis]|uniref:T9SS type A sorting domain-containing protein n=1 Tax=Pontibacter beigongshangensis TaxID=2574733 RepID=UPI00164F94A0|nr:T9SS type A sorting domain-containing protein [Pontibacter beigongshangensis]
MKISHTLRLLLTICFSCFFLLPTEATHLRGGYITYTMSDQNPRSFHFEMVIFRDVHGVGTESEPTVNTGLGSETVLAAPVSRTLIGDQTEKIIYSWTYTYPADGTYTVSWSGINRNNNIINVAQPSEQHSMVLQTTLTVSSLNPDRNGIKYLTPSSTDAYVGVPFKYNLQAFDADGDSLTYTLVSPYRLSSTGSIIPLPGYSIPQGLAINPFGEISWPEPTQKGEYTLAVQVKAYRNERLVSSSINDLQILVREVPESPEITLTNSNGLIVSSAGYILARPGLPLKLSLFVRNPSEKVLQVLASVTELQEPHLADQSSLQVTERDSAGGIVKEIIFTPDNSLRRGWPYALSLRGELQTLENGVTAYKREFVYLLVADQLSNSLPDLLPELAHLLYPNPAGSHFMLEAPAASGAVFRLYALDGRLVQELALQPGRNRVARPSGLSTGLYIYSISSEGYRSRTGKLLLE